MEKKNMKKMIMVTGLSVLVSMGLMTGATYAAQEAWDTGERIRPALIMETVKQNYLASVRLEALRTGNMIPEKEQLDIPASLLMKKVKASEVNMVTNRHTRETQTGVVLDGKTYYASGEAYADTLKKNHVLCYAKDPITNKVVDKSRAVIYVDASGRAFYFESDNSFNDFIALADQDVAYGYSEAND